MTSPNKDVKWLRPPFSYEEWIQWSLKQRSSPKIRRFIKRRSRD